MKLGKNMKKYLPVFLFLIGLIAIIGVYLVTKPKSKKNEKSLTGEVTALLDIPLGKRPFTSLIPKSDGHWLKLKIEKINIPQASSLDYELLYNLPDGRTQGVPGTIEINGQVEIERDILLGSESSGKFRYDEGVKAGTLTLKFRDGKGKLLTKFASDFNLLSNSTKLATVDEKFSYILDKSASKVFFVVMETFGIPEELGKETISGPFAVFSSSFGPYSGKVSIGDGDIVAWTAQKGKVIQKSTLVNGASPDIGIFVSTK